MIRKSVKRLSETIMPKQEAEARRRSVLKSPRFRKRHVHSTARRKTVAFHFLRKRSSLTTSAPSLGLSGSADISLLSTAAVATTGTATAKGAGDAGRLAIGASFSAAPSAGSK